MLCKLGNEVGGIGLSKLFDFSSDVLRRGERGKGDLFFSPPVRNLFLSCFVCFRLDTPPSDLPMEVDSFVQNHSMHLFLFFSLLVYNVLQDYFFVPSHISTTRNPAGGERGGRSVNGARSKDP